MTYLRGHLWLAAAACLVVVGSIGSVIASNDEARNDAQTSRQLLVTSSQEIASTLKLAIQHEQDLVVTTSAFFVRTPDATQAEFNLWMSTTRTFTRYPELMGIAEVVVVPSSRLRAFETRIGALARCVGQNPPLT
jgi:CHASE1-domain containing sensor protein